MFLFRVGSAQRYHEGDKFLSTIDLVNQYDFSQCDVVVADTLQHHNFLGQLTQSQAIEKAYARGSEWLQRNDAAIKQLNAPHRIIRWDSLLAHPAYASYREKVEEDYNQSFEYRQAIHHNVERYIDRLRQLNPETTAEQLFQNGVNYLIEECPIIMPLWAMMGYDFIIYPKPMTEAMEATYQRYVQAQYPDKCRWLYLRFKKRQVIDYSTQPIQPARYAQPIAC